MSHGHAQHGDSTAPDSVEAIAAHLARVRFEDLSATTVAAAKAGILDAIGCALAGTDSVDIAAIVSLVKDQGGTPSSTVWRGGGLKVPPAAAVLANAATIHQFDFDDTHDICRCAAPTSYKRCPPAALAIAEQIGGVTAQDHGGRAVERSDQLASRSTRSPAFLVPIRGSARPSSACSAPPRRPRRSSAPAGCIARRSG